MCKGYKSAKQLRKDTVENAPSGIVPVPLISASSESCWIKTCSLQYCGSGSGSVGSVCFWATWIRIRSLLPVCYSQSMKLLTRFGPGKPLIFTWGIWVSKHCCQNDYNTDLWWVIFRRDKINVVLLLFQHKYFTAWNCSFCSFASYKINKFPESRILTVYFKVHYAAPVSEPDKSGLQIR